MAFAISVNTESNDTYVYAMDGTPSKEKINDMLRDRMGDEFSNICSYDYDSTYDIAFELDYDDSDDLDEEDYAKLGSL
jgi:hypothetical protein